MTEIGAVAGKGLDIQILATPGLSARSQSFIDYCEAFAKKYAPDVKLKSDAVAERVGEGNVMVLPGSAVIRMIRRDMAQNPDSCEPLKTVFPDDRDSVACKEALTALFIAIVKELNRLCGESAQYAAAVQSVTRQEFCAGMPGQMSGHWRPVTKEINLLFSTSSDSLKAHETQTSTISPLESTTATQDYVRHQERSIFRKWDLVITLPAATK